MLYRQQSDIFFAEVRLKKRSFPLRLLFDQLFETFGPQGWWPTTPAGEDRPRYFPGKCSRHLTDLERWEIIVGAILTQNTAWRNVEAALSQLWAAELMDIDAILEAPEMQLAMAVRPSGYYNQKASRLRSIAAYITGAATSVTEFLQRDPDELRPDLLSLKGVGPETADSILLYAAQIPRFVVDAYTERILSRIGIVKPGLSYGNLQREFESQLPADHELFNEFHALLVKLATANCKKNPDCQRCCLKVGCNYYTNQSPKKTVD